MIEVEHRQLSIVTQCELVGLGRSSFYYEPAEESAFNLELMRLIDEQYTRTLEPKWSPADPGGVPLGHHARLCSEAPGWLPGRAGDRRR